MADTAVGEQAGRGAAARLGVLGRRDFALLWGAGLVSTLGDWLLTLALPLFVYERTRSMLATGGLFAAQVIPGVLVGPLAGVLVDRWDRRRTLIVADLLRATLLLPLLVALRAPEGPGGLWLVYLCVGLDRLVGLAFRPARGALLPALVPRDRLVAANALDAGSGAAGRLVGPVLGGALAAALGLGPLVLLDAASFVASAALIARIRPAAGAAGQGLSGQGGARRPAAGGWAGMWPEWWAGVRLVGRDRLLRGLLTLAAVLALADAIVAPLFVPFVRDVLGGGPRELGWWFTAQGAGALGAGLVVARAGSRLPPVRLVQGGLVASAALVFAIVNEQRLGLALVLLAALMLPALAQATGRQALLQGAAPEGYRGRVLAAVATTGALVQLAGFGLAGALGDALGIVTVFNAVGALYLLAGLLSFVLLPGPAAGPPPRPPE